MWRSRPISLAGLDDRCAVHQFIRVYGRRPTVDELARCRELAAAPTSTPIGAGATLTLGLTARVRRDIARLITRG